MVLNMKLLNNASHGQSLCVLSFNSRGFCQIKQDFCRELLSVQVVGSSLPLLCNQENFILRSNSYKIRNALPGYYPVIKPAVNPSLENGRAKNGMFIAVPEKLKNVITDVSPESWRLQALILNINSTKILLINSYFPVDPQINNYDESELSETLSYVRQVLLNNNYDHIIWAGDLNADFLRKSKHTRIVQHFIEELNLLKAWDKYDVNFTHYHEVNGVSFTSTLDHLLWSDSLNYRILDAGALHLPSNTSDH